MRFFLIAAWVFAIGSMDVSAATLRVIPLTIKQHQVKAEVASTEETRATGLMFRFSLQPDHGMLFVFETPQPLSFWMKNTYIPLSIAFIDEDGKIINIDDMAPQTERPHPSLKPGLYALEMKKGWFADRGIVSGDRVEGLPRRSGKPAKSSGM